MVGEQPIRFGKGIVIATDRDFVNGFQAGHLAYMAAIKHHPEPHTDIYIVELLLERLEDIRLSSAYGIGFALGWLKELATREPPVPSPTVSLPAATQDTPTEERK